MEKGFPRGSEWRKWDLHLHSPGTKLNDQYKKYKGDVWDRYCQMLEESDVQVFGIADYFSADGYFKTIEEFQKRFPSSTKIFFPNIELRTGDVVNQAQEEVNVHLIFNSFQPNYENEINSFLQNLNTNKTVKGSRKVKVSELNSTRDFEEATTTRESIQDALIETYGIDADLLEYLLIFTAANNDGIRPVSGKKRKLLITDEIDKFSDGFFGHSGNVEYFLFCSRAEDRNVHTKPKPVLSGCDAHSFSDLERKLGKIYSYSEGKFEPTWIKSDLTYEGLKQIIFEPKNRVYIGNVPAILRRIREHATKFIDKLHISSINGYKGQHGSWFNDENILLGKELVAIIGNKGSGKSAVTDIIGLLGNSHNQTFDDPKRKSEELFSFLNSEKFLKRKCAQNFYGELFWYEGQTDHKILNDQTNKYLPEKVEYLPQKYLERICSNIDDDEFRTTLNEVIFRYVKQEECHGKNNLDDLLEYLTQQEKKSLQDKKSKLNEVNKSVVEIEWRLTKEYIEKLIEQIVQKEDELKAHKKAKPQKKPKPPDQGEESDSQNSIEINRLKKKIADFEKEIMELRREQSEITSQLEKIRQFKEAVNLEAGRLAELESNYESTLESIGLSFKRIVNFQLDFNELDAFVEKQNDRLTEIREKLIDPDENDEDPWGEWLDSEESQIQVDSESIIEQKAKLENEYAQLLEQLSRPQQEYETYLEEKRVWKSREREIIGEVHKPAADSLNGLKNELNRIRSKYPIWLEKYKLKQTQVSREIFQLKRNFTEFFNKIKESIDSEIDKYRDDLGDYTISIEAGLRFDRSFVDKFLEHINQNVRGTFIGIEEGRAMIRDYCDDVEDWENEDSVFETVRKIVEALHIDKRKEGVIGKETELDVFKQMKNKKETVVNLYNYLFGFDYLNTKYDLKVDQKNLSELSPGERGGLLLIFYLMLDRRDIPLVIDQPEDNLDNKSVYEILVKFIKDAKKRRQILLVTHNPNLAVVADAEQIINVSINKSDGKHDFSFYSGSIESRRINQVVVDILEGTLPAFDNRRLKYRKYN